MSPNLTRFLRSWITWAEADAPDGAPYYRANGLCTNCYGDFGVETEDELIELFVSQGLCMSYPFGRQAYVQDMDAAAQHLHPPRLAWVRKQLGDK